MIYYLSPIPFNSLWQRHQNLAYYLSSYYPVVFVEKGNKFRLKQLRNNFWKLTYPSYFSSGFLLEIEEVFFQNLNRNLKKKIPCFLSPSFLFIADIRQNYWRKLYSDIPYLIDICDYPEIWERRPDKIEDLKMKKLFSQAVKITYSSQRLGKLLKNIFPDLKEKIVNLPNGHNYSYSDIYRREKRISFPSKFVFAGYPGRWVSKKSIKTIKKYFSVNIINSLSYHKLIPTISKFRVGLIPFNLTHLSYYSFPLKVFDYLAASLIILSSPIPEILDLSKILPNIYFYSSKEELTKNYLVFLLQKEFTPLNYHFFKYHWKNLSENFWRKQISTIISSLS